MKRLFFLCLAGLILEGCSAAPDAARIKPVGPTAYPAAGTDTGYPTLQPGSVPTR